MDISESKVTAVLTRKNPRLLSIDALRGFDMLWILGAEGLFSALYVLSGNTAFKLASEQMLHSHWHGLTAYDVIFPLFIFLSGVSIGLSAKPMALYQPEQRKAKRFHALKRLILLVVLGVVYNHGWGSGIPVSIDGVRFASVLGRIGIAWFVVVMLVWYVSIRCQWLIAAGILLGYWLLLSCVTIAGFGGGDYSQTGALNVWFDQQFLPGIIYQNLAVDPEGLLSNLSSIVNALLGAFVGRLLIKYQQNPKQLLSYLLLTGLSLLCLGYLWANFFPINKTLWTSSFVLVTCGYSVLLLCVFYGVIDVLKIQRWAIFFSVIGINSLLVYLGTSLVNWQYSAHSLFSGLIRAMPDHWQQLLQIIGVILLQWLLLFWLYRRNILVKV